MPRRRGPARPLEPADAAGLPPGLVAEVEAVGGLWWASDYYTTASEVVDQARAVGAQALRLDFHDLSFLADLPDLEYLWLRSDGFPAVTPIGSLRRLRGLIIQTGGMRGELDSLRFPDLRWLGTSLGGKLGPALLEAIQRGHPILRSLEVHETRVRRVTDLGAVGGPPGTLADSPWPNLRSVPPGDPLRVEWTEAIRP